MTLLEIIAAHEASHPRPAIVATPRGLATVAARRLTHILADVPFEERTTILAGLLLSVPADANGTTYTLRTCCPPTRDPQTA